MTGMRGRGFQRRPRDEGGDQARDRHRAAGPGQEAPAPADLVHAEHRHDQDARQQREMHQRDEDAAHRRIDDEVDALGAVGIGARFRAEPGDVRPHQTVRGEQRPGDRRGAPFGEHRRDADEAERQTEGAQTIDLAWQAKLAVVHGLTFDFRSILGGRRYDGGMTLSADARRLVARPPGAGARSRGSSRG